MLPDDFRSSRPEVFCKKGILKISQNLQENTCATVSFEACNLIKKENLAQVFSCEYCEILRTPPVAASETSENVWFPYIFLGYRMETLTLVLLMLTLNIYLCAENRSGNFQFKINNGDNRLTYVGLILH